MIRFNCPSCGQIIKTKDENAGRRGKCPSCSASVMMPAAGTDDVASESPSQNAPPVAPPKAARAAGAAAKARPVPPAAAPKAHAPRPPQPTQPAPAPSQAAKTSPLAMPSNADSAPKPAPARVVAAPPKPAREVAGAPPAKLPTPAVPPIDEGSPPPVLSVAAPESAAPRPRRRAPLMIAGAVAAAAVVGALFLLSGGGDEPSHSGVPAQGDAAALADAPPSADVGSAGDAFAAAPADGSSAKWEPPPVLDAVQLKPVNVGAATDRHPELKIPAKVEFTFAEPARPTAAQARLIAQQFEQLAALTNDQRVKYWTLSGAAIAHAMALDRDKALAILPADFHPVDKASVLSYLASSLRRADRRDEARAAAIESLTLASNAPAPDGLVVDGALFLADLAREFELLGDAANQAKAAGLAEKTAARDPAQAMRTSAALINAMVARGQFRGAIHLADLLPPEARKQFYVWLARHQEDAGNREAAAVMYQQAARIAGRGGVDDERLTFDYATYEPIMGLVRSGARTAAIEQILAIPPTQRRRQAYLEAAMTEMIAAGDYASAIAAAVHAGDLMLAAEAQIKAGLLADAAAGLKRVVAALPPVKARMDVIGADPDYEARNARTELLFELARLQALAGDGDGAVATLGKATSHLSKAPPQSTGPVSAGSQMHWQWPRRRAALLCAAAGRLDLAQEWLDSVVAHNKWAVAMSPNLRLHGESVEGPDRHWPLVQATFAASLFRAGKKEDSAAMFKTAIDGELTWLDAWKPVGQVDQRHPRFASPPTLMLRIAAARAEVGDIDGLLAMYQDPRIAQITTKDGDNNSSEVYDAGSVVAAALARAGKPALALRIVDDNEAARLSIARICHERQDARGVIEAMSIRLDPWQNGRRAAPEEARWLTAAAVKADLDDLRKFARASGGWSLPEVATARAAGDKEGARQLLEQGLEQAALRGQQAQQTRLIDAMRQIGESQTADALAAIVAKDAADAAADGQERRGPFFADEDEAEGFGGEPPIRPRLDIRDRIRQIEAVKPGFRYELVARAGRSLALVLHPPAPSRFRLDSFEGHAETHHLIDRISTRWIRMERPPTILNAAEGNVADPMEVLARELRLFRRASGYAIPQSLQEMAQARRIDLAMIVADPASIEVVRGLPLDSGPQVVLMYEKKPGRGGLTTVVTVPGLVEVLSADELTKRLKNPPKAVAAAFDRTPLPPDTRWAAYGEPPVAVNRRAFDPNWRAPVSPEFNPRDPQFGPFFVNGATRSLEINLHNLGATLRAYALAHGGVFAESLEQVRKAGFLIHEEDVQHPLGETYGYMIVGKPATNSFGQAALAWDTSPFFSFAGRGIDGPHYQGQARFADQKGQVHEVPVLSLNSLPSGKDTPPLRSFKIDPAAPLHVRARMNLINLRTILQQYAAKNGGRFPKELMDLVKEGYLPDTATLRSPVDPKVGYTYYTGLTVDAKAGSVLLFDPVSCDYPVPGALLAGHVGLDATYHHDHVARGIRSGERAEGRPRPLVFGDSPPANPAATVAAHGNFRWPVTFANAPAAKDHPLAAICDRTYELKIGSDTVVVGVAFGPKFVRPSDDSFQSFLFQVKRNLDRMAPPRLASQQIAGVPDGDRQDPRSLRVFVWPGSSPPKTETVAYIRGDNDRCAAYWFSGPREHLGVLKDAVGQAAWTAAAEPTAWKARAASTPWPPDAANQKNWRQWKQVTPPPDHPLAGLCKEYREMPDATIVGVVIGPRMTDQEATNAFDARIKREFDSRATGKTNRRTATQSYNIPGFFTVQRTYSGFESTIQSGVISVVTGVEDSHCVAYWTLGPKAPIDAVLGAATLTLDD